MEHTVELLSFSNPAFSAYAVAAALMILKMVGMAWLTVYRLSKVQAGYRSPEDEKRSPLNKNPAPGQYGPHEYVDRARRIHQNDGENVPLFLAVGLLFVLTAPDPTLATVLFAGYVITRVLHFLAYVTAQLHDVRAAMWTPGALMIMGMALHVIVHAVRA